MARLSGKKALITGGTTGIGFATAKLFLEEGAQVAIAGQSQERLQAALSRLGDNAVGIQADLSTVDGVQGMINRVKSDFGSLDILVANAGITKPLPASTVDEANINEQFDINFKGVFFAVQKALPILQNPASIVLTTSCLNETGMPGMSIYAASKAAVRSLARSLSAELVEKGIRVNAVSPGPIETPIYSKLGMLLRLELFLTLLGKDRLIKRQVLEPQARLHFALLHRRQLGFSYLVLDDAAAR